MEEDNKVVRSFAAQQSVHTFATLRQVGFVAIFEHFSGVEFFLLPSRVHARPSASNANRWAAQVESKKIMVAKGTNKEVPK